MLARVFVAVALASVLLAAPSSGAPPDDGPQTASYRLEPKRREQAIAYSRARYVLFFAGTAWGIAVLLLFLFARIGPSVRNLAEGVFGSPGLQVLVAVPILVLLLAVLDLPLGIWGHGLALRYEQSIQGWGSWGLDWVKGQAIGAVIATLLAAIFYAVIRWSPERAWIWFWLAAQPVLLFMLFVQPLVIAPLFFDFTPLAERHADLAQEMEKVLARAELDIPPERMFEMNASSKLRSVNAYVSGIGASKRVVVWDTTIAKMSTAETLFVFAHETGHYVLGHVLRLLAVSSVGLLVFFAVGQWAASLLLARFGALWQIRGLDDLASLPLLLLVISVLAFFSSPIGNAYSRRLEHEADVYALDLTRDVIPDARGAAVSAFQTLGDVDLVDPDPPAFVRFWLLSHPPIGERIAFASTYAPPAVVETLR